MRQRQLRGHAARLPAVTEEQTRQRAGNGVRKLVERCIPENKRTEAMVDACLDDFRTAYNERMMNRTQPYDGILPLLKELKRPVFRSACFPTNTIWPPRG